MTVNNRRQFQWVVLGILAALLIVAGTWMMVGVNNQEAAAPPPEAQVQITEDGFVPAQLTVAPGTRVVWVNNTSAAQQVAAAPYPDRTQLPSLDSGQVSPGESYVFTFRNKGTFEYANYTNLTQNGTIEVK